MLRSLKQSWKSFAAREPGTRFLTTHEENQVERRSPWKRLALIGAGLLLILVGLVALVAPGPGLLGIGLGLALIARESEWLSRAMDRLEVALRKLWRRYRPTPRTRQ